MEKYYRIGLSENTKGGQDSINIYQIVDKDEE